MHLSYKSCMHAYIPVVYSYTYIHDVCKNFRESLLAKPLYLGKNDATEYRDGT